MDRPRSVDQREDITGSPGIIITHFTKVRIMASSGEEKKVQLEMVFKVL